MLNLLGVILAFILIIILIRKKVNFGLALIFGALIIGIFSIQTLSARGILNSFSTAILYSLDTQTIDTSTLELALLMGLIFTLAKTMQSTGAITILIDSLKTFFTKGGTLAVIPAVYGLMPVPGGALFSAPLVDQEGEKYNLKQNEKNYLNVWFRHIWFPIYPISSTVILICSAQFADIDIYALIAANFPAFLIMIFVGYLVLYKFVRIDKKTVKPKKNYNGLIYLTPPLLPIVIYLLFQFLHIPRTRTFILGVVLSIVLLYFLLKIPLKSYLNSLKKNLGWNMALAFIGIMIFRQIIDDSGVTTLIQSNVGSLNVPPIILIVFIPLFLGVITGYNLGAIALSYPIIASLQGDIHIISFASIIFVSSFVGYLISPIHLCNVASSEYLKTDTTKMYNYYLPSALILLIVHVLSIESIFRFII